MSEEEKKAPDATEAEGSTAPAPETLPDSVPDPEPVSDSVSDPEADPEAAPEAAPDPTAPADPHLERYRATRRLNALVAGLLLAAIVAMVNYLAFRHYTRFDWTAGSVYTLSERSATLLGDLDRDISIYVFLSEGEPGYADLEELLGRYRAASPRVSVEQVDLDRKRSRAERLAERFGIEFLATPEGLALADVAAVVASGEASWKIGREDLIEQDFGAPGEAATPVVNVQTESALTGAILQVVEGRSTRLCLSEGHGEWSLDGERSLFALRELFENENLEVESLDAVGLRAVPEGCEAVLVLGPQRPFATSEAEVLFTWARAGGSLLLALDPVLSRDAVAPTGFEDAAADAGIRIDASVVLELDRSRVLTEDPSGVLLSLPTSHPATDGAARRGGPVVFELVRSVRAAAGEGATALFETSASAFAETNIPQFVRELELRSDADDVPGPVAFAVARQLPPPPGAESEPGQEGHDADADARGGRVIVIGDADWLRPAFVNDPQFANFDLLTGSLAWLTRRSALAAIPPRQSPLAAVRMSPADMSGVRLRIFLFLPGAVALLGFAVAWSRRR
ncbi:MAG: GldG family protein [Myxococcota bacterium]